MPRISIETRNRVVVLYHCRRSVDDIKKRLEEENSLISSRALYNLIRKYRGKHIVVDCPRRKCPRKISEEMMAFIDAQLSGNDELTSRKIQELLKNHWPDTVVSLPTIRRVRKELGLVSTRPHYCQLLREVCIPNLKYT